MVICKDAKGKCGVSFYPVNKGVFVCFVQKGSPAAMGGIRFGDQILTVSLGAIFNCSFCWEYNNKPICFIFSHTVSL